MSEKQLNDRKKILKDLGFIYDEKTESYSHCEVPMLKWRNVYCEEISLSMFIKSIYDRGFIDSEKITRQKIKEALKL